MKNNAPNYFLDLVQIDSPSGSETNVSKYLQLWLKKHKFNFKIDKVGNIYARNDGNTNPLLFCTHMDTVEPGTGIKPAIKDDFVKSSGSTILGADNKSTIAALLASLENYNGKRMIELIFSVKEETTGGIQYFPVEWISAKQAIICDSAKPLGGIILRSPSIYNFYTTFIGKAAHASTPNNGKNAFLPAIDALYKIPVGEMDDKKTTINIGLLSGGTGMNTVPDNIKITGEVRSYDKKLFEKHLKNVEEIMKKSSLKYSAPYNFWKDGYCPGYTHGKSDQAILKICEVYKKLNLTPKFYLYSGISDANILNSKGIKTINLTDGVIDPHTVNERIALSSLEKLSEIIHRILLSY